MVFNVAVLDGGGVVPALHLYKAGLPAGGFVVAVPKLGMRQDVVGVFFMKLGRVRLHGLLHIQDKGLFVVRYRHQSCRLGGGHLVFGHHHGHFVAVIADVTVQQQPVGHILVVGIGGPGMSGRREGDVRHIEAGENFHHAGNLFRLGGIHRAHHSVGNGRVDNPSDQCGAIAEVVRVFGAAGGLIKGVHAEFTFSYAAHLHQPPVFL